MAPDINPVVAIVAALAIAILLVLGTSIIGAVADVDKEQRDDAVVLDQTANGEFAEIRPFGIGFDETVRNSRGNAMRFAGTDDSFVEAKSQFTFNLSQNWTISQGAKVDSGATGENMTVLSLGGGEVQLLFTQNDTGSNVWQVHVFRSTSSHVANVSAGSPTDWSVVQVTRSGSNITIFNNNTQGESLDLSNDSVSNVNLTGASNFDGDLDETQLYQQALDSSQRQSLVDDPVHPLGVAPNARMMYDERNGAGNLRLYFTSTSAKISNATLVGGFAGEVLTEDTLLSSGDYNWKDDGPQISPVSGGLLDNHPVAFASYTYKSAGDISTGFGDAVDLAALLPILLIASIVVVLVRRSMTP